MGKSAELNAELIAMLRQMVSQHARTGSVGKITMGAVAEALAEYDAALAAEPAAEFVGVTVGKLRGGASVSTYQRIGTLEAGTKLVGIRLGNVGGPAEEDTDKDEPVAGFGELGWKWWEDVDR